MPAPSLADVQGALARQKRGGVKLTPQQEEILAFQEGRSNAGRDVGGQMLTNEQIGQARALGGTVAQDAATRTPYAMDPRDNSLESAAMGGLTNAPVRLMQNASARPEALGLSAGMEGQAAALDAAQRLGGAGSYAAGLQRAGGEFGGDVNLVRRAAMGAGPSAAEALMRSSLDANARQARSIASGARGGNLAAGIRGAIGAGTAANQQSIQQLAALRANEQLSALAQLPGAQAQRMAALTGAQNAETGRQTAAGQVGGIAAGAGADLAKTAIAGQATRNEAVQAGGQLYNQGIQTATGARQVQAGVAADAATDLERQKQRALQAYGMFTGNVNNEQQLRNNRIIQRMGGQITPASAVGIGANVLGSAIGAAF